MPESNIPSAGASFQLFYDPFVAGEAPQAETFSNRMTAVKRRPKPAYGVGTPDRSRSVERFPWLRLPST
jgi:hypothetical protein